MALSPTLSFTPELADSQSRVAPRRTSGWWLLLLALIAILPYLNSLANDFAYDDVMVVQEDSRVINLEWTSLWSQNYWGLRDGMPPDILYRPLTTWSYLANQAVAPGSAPGFHIVNILLHALTSVLVAVLAWKLLEKWWIAAIAGLLFALHPLHTEAVANIVGRAELLASTWSLLALIIYLPRSLKDDDLLAPRRLYHGWLVGVCFFAAILCKETPAALIAMFPCIDLWRWMRATSDRRPTLLRWTLGQALHDWLPSWIFLAIYLAMRIHATGLMTNSAHIHPLVNALVNATPLERVVTPFALWAKYLLLMVWPAVLTADYSSPSILPTANPFSPLPLIGILSVLLGLLIAFRSWKKSAPVALTLVLMVFSYALVSNVIRIGTIFGERLFYWPSVFVLIVAAWGAVTLWERREMLRYKALRPIAACLLAVACIAMTIRTWTRNADWHDNVTLAISTARDSNNSAKALQWAGVVLRLRGSQPWMREFGQKLLERSAELYPSFYSSHWELAKCYGIKDDFAPMLIEMGWTAYYQPGGSDLRVGLKAVDADLAAKKDHTFIKQIDDYCQANPTSPVGPFAQGLILKSQKKYPESILAFRRALALSTYFHEAAVAMADAEFQTGQIDDAILIYHRYLSLMKTSIDGHCMLALHLMALDPKKYPSALDEATTELAIANKLCPNSSKIREMQYELIQAKRRIADGRNPEAISAKTDAGVASASKNLAY